MAVALTYRVGVGIGVRVRVGVAVGRGVRVEVAVGGGVLVGYGVFVERTRVGLGVAVSRDTSRVDSGVGVGDSWFAQAVSSKNIQSNGIK